MRTTVTLEPDVERLVKQQMSTRGVGFKQALNDAVRAGLGSDSDGEPLEFETFDMGKPKVDLTKALRLAGELEDADLIRRASRDQ